MLNYQSGALIDRKGATLRLQPSLMQFDMPHAVVTVLLPMPGIRPPYVPALSLHVAASAQYAPASSDTLLH